MKTKILAGVLILAFGVGLYFYVVGPFSSQKRGDTMVEQNLSPQQRFLLENKSQPGVQVSATGLQYQILQEGGRKPIATDRVRVHYKGTLVDGTEFDSSHKRGEPISFPLRGVIAGWTEGLQYVGEGGKIKLFIPPELGYGSRDMGSIPPDSVLIFEVDLLAVE